MRGRRCLAAALRLAGAGSLALAVLAVLAGWLAGWRGGTDDAG